MRDVLPISMVQRFAAPAGFLFVVFLLVGVILPGEVPGGSDPDSDVVSFYEDSENRIRLMASGYLFTLAGLMFLIFLSGLRERLALREGGQASLTRLGFAGGVLLVAMLFVLAAADVAVPAGIAFQDEPVDPGVARFLIHLGFAAFLLPGMFAAILLILCTSIVTLQSSVFPRWSAWLGLVVAAILLFGVLFVTVIALLIWVLVISALLARRQVTEPLS